MLRSPRIRIGIVADDFPPNSGGMAVHAEHVARELTAHCEVVVFTQPGFGLADAPFEQRRVLTCDLAVDRRRIADCQVDAWLLLNAGYAAVAPSLNAPVFAYFHGNDFLNGYRGFHRPWVERLRRLPYFWRHHRRLRSFLRRGDMRRGLKAVVEVFTNSTNSASLIQKIYGRSARVIPPGVHKAFFQAPETDQRPGLRLLTVSRLPRNSRKNVDGVLRAVATCPHELGIAYTVVGDGHDRPRLEALSRELGIADRVSFRGRVSQEELFACYRQADLFILAPKATAHDVEGFGIVYVEACASGTPVIGSAEGGATDAIRDGVNGILIPDSSPEAIARGIDRFDQSRDRFTPQRLVEFAQQYRWPNLVARMWQLMAERLPRVDGAGAVIDGPVTCAAEASEPQ